MMTPILNPATRSQELYNAAHKSTRGLVERSFVVLKQRFRVLDESSGYIMSNPEKTALVVACMCLHNLTIRNMQELGINEGELEAALEQQRREACDRASRQGEAA